MRRSLSAVRTGISVAAAVVLLTACGGSGDDDSASASSSETSAEATESSASEEGSEFCTDAANLLGSIDPALSGQSGTDGIGPLLQQASDGVRAIEAPPEIADDWTALADALSQLATAFADLDPADPQSQAEFGQAAAAIQGEVGTSITNVQTYLAEECGVDLAPSEPAAPTS
jgi:hypothetical protein